MSVEVSASDVVELDDDLVDSTGDIAVSLAVAAGGVSTANAVTELGAVPVNICGIIVLVPLDAVCAANTCCGCVNSDVPGVVVIVITSRLTALPSGCLLSHLIVVII